MKNICDQIYFKFYKRRIGLGDEVWNKVSDNYVPIKQEIYKQMSPILFREVWNELKKNK
jgi:hypothetical protein